VHWFDELNLFIFWLSFWHAAANKSNQMIQKRIYHPDNGTDATSKGKEDKYTFKDVMIIVFGWLVALSLVYICYLKFQIFLHH